jgi:fatty acid-binding protein DegV
MIQIFTDTSANLPAAYIQKYSLRVIPLTYFVDGVEAHQDPAVDFDGKAYYDAMRSGTPVSTAMINLGAFARGAGGRRRRDLYRHVRRH